MASVVETVSTYIPEDVIGLFKRVDAYEIDPFIDHEMAAKVLVSVYHDVMNADDPSGLGILSHIAMKLMTLPQYTLRARRVYENIEMLLQDRQLIIPPNMIQNFDSHKYHFPDFRVNLN